MRVPRVELSPRARTNPVSLSVCLIVRDAESTLTRCLESISPIADEIIVVDTGSIDSTVEIAEAFDARVGYFEWCDDFSAARNEALRLATSKFILSIDADEWLSPNSASHIDDLKYAFGGRQEWAMHTVAVENSTSEEDACVTFTGPRLFPRSGTAWKRRIHEYPDNPRFNVLLNPRIRIQHEGYQADQSERTARNLRILRAGLESASDEEDFCHYLFYICRYGVGISGYAPKDLTAGYERCVAGGTSMIRCSALDLLMDCYYALGDFDRMIELCERHREDLTFYSHSSLIAAYAKADRMDEARAAFSQLYPNYVVQRDRGTLDRAPEVVVRMETLIARLQVAALR
ncbi:MAG TPA: glycosyltransferase family 2 protein [Fimbriimonadaceae bacterium]|nr:glycosyltransferase family 2 protein [Fimbriimonadaceae bacterium]